MGVFRGWTLGFVGFGVSCVACLSGVLVFGFGVWFVVWIWVWFLWFDYLVLDFPVLRWLGWVWSGLFGVDLFGAFALICDWLFELCIGFGRLVVFALLCFRSRVFLVVCLLRLLVLAFTFGFDLLCLLLQLFGLRGFF